MNPRTSCSCVQLVVACLSACLFIGSFANASDAKNTARVILVVWDGLRPDMVSATDTPNLAQLRDQGIEFTDHHSTYPTLTMINAAAFATGAYPGTHGFYGNWVWAPHAQGRDSADHLVDFTQPVFTEDYAILQALDRAEQGKLFTVPTLFEIAARAKLSTAIVGKGGPTFLQSRHGGSPFIDDKTVMPLSFATELAAASLPLPKLWSNAYPADAVPTHIVTDNPTATDSVPLLKDGVTPDPTKADAAPYAAVNAYHARVFFDYVLPKLQPRLALLWLRNPDSTEHAFGPGSLPTRAALHANDALLGGLMERLKQLGLAATTNVMVVSDHGHSHVSGSLAQFPLRAINNGVIGAIDPAGFAVSGDVRTADLMRRAGLRAYDGMHEQCDPIMSGIGVDGLSIYLRKSVDAQLNCKSGLNTTGDFAVPSRLPAQHPYAVIVPAGGTEYIYVPTHDREFLQQVVRFLQSRKQYGAIFIDAQRYGELPGTLPLSTIHLANANSRNPDLVVSFNFDADASINGVPGTEYSSSYSGINRGMHGTFGPRDVHNVLIANGPDFKQDLHRDELPSANVDVAPTIAKILGLSMPNADGRVLSEALRNGSGSPSLLREEVLRPKQPASSLQIVEPTDPDGKNVDTAATQYNFELHTKLLRDGKREYRYFDRAQAVRY
jgi:arylsulfatase A-like enzyme